MTRLDMQGRRGAAGQQYAIVIGLIAVVAIASITAVGRQTTNLFTNVSNRLSNLGDGAATGSGGADPAQTCANGSQPVARVMRGTQEYWLCRGARTYALPASALLSCPASGWTGTSIQSFDGSTSYGAFRYEVSNDTATASTTTTTLANYTCANSTCTSAGGGANNPVSTTRSYATNVFTCAVSLDNYSIANGTTAYNSYANGGVGQTDFTFGAMGGIGANNWGARPMASMYFLRGVNSLSFVPVDLVSEKIWLQTRP